VARSLQLQPAVSSQSEHRAVQRRAEQRRGAQRGARTRAAANAAALRLTHQCLSNCCVVHSRSAWTVPCAPLRSTS
jgi:hypothetical protein